MLRYIKGAKVNIISFHSLFVPQHLFNLSLYLLDIPIQVVGNKYTTVPANNMCILYIRLTLLIMR